MPWCDPPVRKNVRLILFVLVRLYVSMAVYTVITVYSLKKSRKIMAMVKYDLIHKTNHRLGASSGPVGTWKFECTARI